MILGGRSARGRRRAPALPPAQAAADRRVSQALGRRREAEAEAEDTRRVVSLAETVVFDFSLSYVL